MNSSCRSRNVGTRILPIPSIVAASVVGFGALLGGFTLDVHVIRHLGLGGHAEYVTVDSEPFAAQWIALGLHADLVL
jgi:hypothetical protein